MEDSGDKVESYCGQDTSDGQAFVKSAHDVDVFFGYWSCSILTKKVPIMEAMIAIPPMSSGMKNAGCPHTVNGAAEQAWPPRW